MSDAPAYGEIYDRGYRHYEGARRGRRQAFAALIMYSAARSLGLRKRWTAKVMPFLLYGSVLIVTVVLIGVEAFVGQFLGGGGNTYAEFFGFIFLIEGLFVATVAPEMLCPDRREGVLTLYFSRAITPLDYVLAKVAATALLTMTLSVLPPVLLWFFHNLLADAPLSSLLHSVDDLGRIVVTGGMIALYLGAIGLAIASFTGRRAIAVAVIIVGYVVTEALVNVLIAILDEARLADWLQFLSPAVITSELALALFSGPGPSATAFGWWAYALGMLATSAVAIAIMLWRYLPER